MSARFAGSFAHIPRICTSPAWIPARSPTDRALRVTGHVLPPEDDLLGAGSKSSWGRTRSDVRLDPRWAPLVPP